jgi:hypothetical protein
VIDTQGWKNMISLHPRLVAETFKALVTQSSPTLGSNPRKKFKSSHVKYE